MVNGKTQSTKLKHLDGRQIKATWFYKMSARKVIRVDLRDVQVTREKSNSVTKADSGLESEVQKPLKEWRVIVVVDQGPSLRELERDWVS